VPSPFESPAFWELTAQDTPRIMDAIPPRPTPPVWDPLGVAPFAWELPEPPPRRTVRRSKRGTLWRVVPVRCFSPPTAGGCVAQDLCNKSTDRNRVG
jgi:hypothetical protein